MYAARYRSAHFRDFTLRTIKIVLKAHGFRLEQAVGSAFYLPKIEEFWSPLATCFSFMGAHGGGRSNQGRGLCLFIRFHQTNAVILKYCELKLGLS